MKEKEKDELLYRIDERTERMERETQRRLSKLEAAVQENSDEIDSVKSNTLENTNDLRRAKTFMGFIGSAVLAALAKIFGALRYI